MTKTAVNDPDKKALFSVDFWWRGSGFGFTLWRWGIDAQVKLRGRSKILNRGYWPEDSEPLPIERRERKE